MTVPASPSENAEWPRRDELPAAPSALPALRERCHGALLNTLLARGATRTEAEDLLADLWADCVSGQPERPSLVEKFSGRCSLQGWLATVATNRWIDLRRRQTRRGETSLANAAGGEGDSFDRLPAPVGSVSEGPLVELLRESLRAAFARCGREAMVLLRLVHIHGVTQREAARMMGWSEFKISRSLSEAMRDIEADTLREVKRRDPWLELTWQDFVDLCETHEVGFL